MNLDALLEQAKSTGRISPADLRNVRDALRTGDPRYDRYTLLHIIGKADDRESAGLVRSFLQCGLDDPEDDGMVRRIALHVLGIMWSTADVFDEARRMGEEDPSPFVRMIAASALGHLGAVHVARRRDAAVALLTGFRRTNEEPEVREAYYFGLLELLQIPMEQRPMPGRSFRASDQIIGEAERLTEE